jgi:hypothetical protein
MSGSTEKIAVTPEMIRAGAAVLMEAKLEELAESVYRAMESKRRERVESAGKRLLVVDDDDRVIGSLPPLTTSTYSPGDDGHPCGWYNVDSLSAILPIIGPDRVRARDHWWPLPVLRKIPGFDL